MSETTSPASDPTIPAQSVLPIARARLHGNREIILPADLLVRANGEVRRHPHAGSYLKGANAALLGHPIESCPYPRGEDADWWRRGWNSNPGGE